MQALKKNTAIDKKDVDNNRMIGYSIYVAVDNNNTKGERMNNTTYSIGKVAKMIGVSYATIKREIDDGKIPYIQVREMRRIPVSAYEAYIKPKRNAPN